MIVQTVADVVPNGVAAPLVPNSPHVYTPARWIQISASGSTVRYGDSNVSATRGAAIPNGTVAQVGQDPREGQAPYDVAQIYVFATGTDKVSVTYGL